MKKIKKKIYSLISSLLIPSSFLSTSSKFKAFDEDEYVIQEYEEDQDDEDEETSEEENEYDDYGLKVGTADKILNYAKNHPLKTAGWLSLFAITRGVVSGTYDTLRSPSGKSWDEITTELITKHLANEQENKSKAFNEINNEDKMITIINILRDISKKMADRCTFLAPLTNVIPEFKLAKNAIKDILYYKIQENNNTAVENMLRKAIERNIWMCYHVALTLKKCCDKLGLKSAIKLNYTGHSSLLLTPPSDFDYFINSANYSFAKGEVLELHAVAGECCSKKDKYAFDKVTVYTWYSTDIIYGKNKKCYRLVENKNSDNTSKVDHVFDENDKKLNELLNKIINNDTRLCENENIVELVPGTKPLNYTPPASYIDMLRQP